MRIRILTLSLLALAWTMPAQAQTFINPSGTNTTFTYGGGTAATTSSGVAGVMGSAPSFKNTPSFFKPSLPSDLKLTNFLPSLPNFQSTMLGQPTATSLPPMQQITIMTSVPQPRSGFSWLPSWGGRSGSGNGGGSWSGGSSSRMPPPMMTGN